MEKFTQKGLQRVIGFTSSQAVRFVTVLGMLVLLPAAAFSQDKAIEKANQAYKYKQYAQAATIYETIIAEKEGKKKKSISTLNLKTKLAYCYRMNNKLDKAEQLYAEIVQDDRAKTQTYLFYGETLMSNGKYEEAKKWFSDYQKIEPDDKQAALLAENCDKVQLIEPYFPYVDIQPFVFNSDADDNAPVLWNNGVVFSSDRKQGVKFMKEKSGWTGRDYLDLYFSALEDDGTYSEPRRFSSKLSEVNKNTGNASFSTDGKEVYFTRNDNELNKAGTYNLQLFRSIQTESGRWKKADKLSFCSPNSSFMHPAISPDGKELFFASNRKGEGGVDLWIAERKGEGWGKPVNLGPTINTSGNEGFPFVDENGRLYFCSKGHPGYGGFDIFFTERNEEGEWSTPQNLGQPINSSLDDISIFINDAGRHGMFTSSRGGGDDDIYFFEVLDEAPVTSPLAEVLSSSKEGPGPYVNQKPSEVHLQETAEPTTLIEEQQIPEEIASSLVSAEVSEPSAAPEAAVEETTELMEKGSIDIEEKIEEVNSVESVATDPSVPGVPENYEPVNAPINEVVSEESVKEDFDPFSDLPLSDEVFEEEPAEEVTSEKADQIFFEMPPEQVENEEVVPAEIEDASVVVANDLFSFNRFMEEAHKENFKTGQIYRVDGAVFDANIWQLTPRISRKLNDLVAVMRKYPSMKIELSAHTETLGIESQNLELSKNRVEMAIEFMVKEGIDPERIIGVGYGEAHPLNHCVEGISCTMEEHAFNQRFELRILKGIEQ